MSLLLHSTAVGNAKTVLAQSGRAYASATRIKTKGFASLAGMPARLVPLAMIGGAFGGVSLLCLQLALTTKSAGGDQAKEFRCIWALVRCSFRKSAPGPQELVKDFSFAPLLMSCGDVCQSAQTVLRKTSSLAEKKTQCTMSVCILISCDLCSFARYRRPVTQVQHHRAALPRLYAWQSALVAACCKSVENTQCVQSSFNR